MNYNLLFKNINHPIKTLLDVGFHKGEFSEIMDSVYNFESITAFDINPNLNNNLKEKYNFYNVGLSNENKKVILYLNRNNSTCTGTSYYKENTRHYENPLELEVDVKSLDSIFDSVVFDFVKIDTQGSEYDIIEGGKNILKNSKYILVETSVGDYNEGSKKELDTIELLSESGFVKKQILHEFKLGSVVQQRDILFESKNI